MTEYVPRINAKPLIKALRALVLAGLLAGVLTALLVPGAHAQESRTLNVGRLGYSTNSAFTGDDINWPRDRPWTTGSMLENYGIIIGTALDWTDENGASHNVKVAQVAENKFSDQESVVVPVAGDFERIYRNPYPSKIIDGENRTDILAQEDQANQSLPSDAVIYNHATTWTDIDIERWSYAFADSAKSDLVIQEFRFTNTSGEQRDDVYFGLTAATSQNVFYPGDIWGNYYGATYRQYAEGDRSADSMRVWYSWDADDEPDRDGKGSPNSQWGVFGEPQYMAFATVHADQSATDESDAPAQPGKAGWSQRELSPNLNEATHEVMYDFLNEGWNSQNPSSYATTVNAMGNQEPEGPYRILKPGVETRNYDPETEQEKSALFSYGPYQLAPGEDVRIVVAFAGGAISNRLSIDAGRAYDNGFPEQQPLVPLPYDVFGPEGDLIAPAGTEISMEQKDRMIDEIGRHRALQKAGQAINIWNGGNVEAGEGSFDVELAPAAPSLTGYSENDQIRLEWGDEAANDTEAGPIAGYRIYRDYDRPPSLVTPTDTTFTLIAEVGPDQREYIDDEVVRGEDRYYYVTAVTEGGLESSPFLNRTGTSSTREDEALTATRPPSEDWRQSVVVVPNPYHTQAAEKYPGRRINFLNLPAYADIHIYTTAGDRVQTVEHRSGTGEEDYERQTTFNVMEIASGIYYYVVEELDGPDGSPTGSVTRGKFVVIK